MWALLLLAAFLDQPAGPARTCQAALGPLDRVGAEAALADRIDGAAIRGRDSLVALRRARGDALITVAGGDFSGADFRGARLHNICFLDTVFAGSNWSGVEAPGVGFVRASLSGANLRGARMADVLFREPDLEDADASGADFSGGRLDGGWNGSVENLRLDRANLTGFNFACGGTISDGCPVDGEMSLRGTDLTRASIHSYGRVSDWTGARLDRTEVSFYELTRLRDAVVAGPLLVRGGDSVAALSPAEHRALLPHMRAREDSATPSFDCARAASPTEALICGESGGTLRWLDRTVAALYRRAGAAAAESQVAWLRRRDRCPVTQSIPDLACVQQSYEQGARR